jgi:YidC/Oxa1 family membrane protein insertase
MDRNTVIGFVLLGLLLFAYLFVSTKNSQELQAIQERKEDSLARIKKIQDSIKIALDTTSSNLFAEDTVAVKGFNTKGKPSETIVENELLKIVFTNKGGQPRKVELKNYKTHDGAPVYLNSSNLDKFSYPISTGNGQSLQVADLLFEPAQVTKGKNGSQVVTFKATGERGEQVLHQYTIPATGYLIEWKAGFAGADKLFSNGNFDFTWQSQPLKLEKDVTYERQQTNVGFEMEGDFDYIQAKNQRTLEKQVSWVSVCQQFFNTTLIAKNAFTSGEIQIQKTTGDSVAVIADITTKLKASMPLGQTSGLDFQLYFGPTDYAILKKIPVTDLDKLVNLGRDMYTFVRPINKYIMMPVFQSLADFITNFGLVIALLTIFIRLITSPLVYSSYLSGAKMKALKPEIDKLKEKFSNDQQQFGM